jgi:predicted kinase
MAKNKNNKIKKEQLEFVVLVGPPCSGKSTFVKQPKYDNYVKASIDDIIGYLHPNLTYNEAYHGNGTSCTHCNFLYAEKLFKRIFLNEVRKQESSIIIDKTNLTSKSRRKLLATVPDTYRKIAVVFDWDMKMLKERNEKRAKETGKFISEPVLQQMNDMFVPIQSDEGFNKVISIKR